MVRSEASSIVQRLWNYCDVLRDDGVSYSAYVEQLTYLLFLKMADEQTKPPFNKPSIIPEALDWPSLVAKDGAELEEHYRYILRSLGQEKGMLGDIFRRAIPRIQDPAKLKRLIGLINEETWVGLDIDVKGEIYEGLLQKNAEDVKSGAGQYFTPRPLIKAIVEVMRPEPGMTIFDPACGTGGFFIAAHDYISHSYPLSRDEKDFLKNDTFKGWEIVPETARLCLMNLYLHGIGGYYEDKGPITVDDSLISQPSKHYDMVLTNPPFGRKSSITIMNTKGRATRKTLIYERPDFWATTTNKQLNFLQHVKSLLKIHGRAAIVVPDNVLFEGGAGETTRRKLLHECDVHTLLRLSTGVFYAQGVKANVLFFDRKPASETPWTKELWIYDLRTNKHFTQRQNPLTYKDLKDFIECYNPENRHQRKETARFRRYTYDKLMERDKVNLDIVWIEDQSLKDTETLSEPEFIAKDIVESLESALQNFSDIYEDLTGE